MSDKKDMRPHAKNIYLTKSMIDEIRRQMPIYGSKYFSDHIRTALRIGLDILKEREAHVSLENTTEKVSEQP